MAVTYARFPGASGDYISTPDSATQDIANDFEIWARIAPDDWTPASSQTIVSKWASAQLSYLLQLNSNGKLQLSHSTDGTNAFNDECPAACGFTDGSIHWVRVQRGAGDNFSTFYTLVTETIEPPGPTDTAAWVSLGSSAASAAGVIFNSTTEVELGAYNVGTQNRFIGNIFRCIMWKPFPNLGGTKGHDFIAANAQRSSDTTLVGSGTSSEVWTRHGGVTFEPPDRSLVTTKLGAQARITSRLATHDP